MEEVIASLPTKLFETPDAFEEWLSGHYAEPGGIWLKIAKKNTGAVSVTYSEALEIALCYGWIDGQLKTYDATYYLQRFTPRRQKSIWSLTNTKKIEALLLAGKMKPSGMAAVAAAKKDGRWDAAYSSQREMTLPDDFAAAINANKKAKDFFNTLNKVNRYAFYYRVQDAKRPETRQRRIEKFVQMLENGEKLY
jgi:uncharacterized protein YdeI (YjbR/CyaY-like superfamily)